MTSHPITPPPNLAQHDTNKSLQPLLRPGYEAGNGFLVKGSQLVDGKWFCPSFGSDSLQYVVDNYRYSLAKLQSSLVDSTTENQSVKSVVLTNGDVLRIADKAMNTSFVDTLSLTDDSEDPSQEISPEEILKFAQELVRIVVGLVAAEVQP